MPFTKDSHAPRFFRQVTSSASWQTGLVTITHQNFFRSESLYLNPFSGDLSGAICLSRKPFQKNPRVRKIFVRNSGAGNGCANFMGAWKKLRPFCRKTSMSIKFLVLGGGVFWVLGGGGECRFYFYGREDFSEPSCLLRRVLKNCSGKHLWCCSRDFNDFCFVSPVFVSWIRAHA